MVYRRRRRVHSEEGVTLNMAAMLDMAFQLLTFFILTFKPSTIEQQIALKLPPPERVVPQNETQKAQQTNPDAVGLLTLHLEAFAGADGRLASLVLEHGQKARDLQDLSAKMADILKRGGAEAPIEQVIVEIDPNLQVQEVMQIFDICLSQKLANGERVRKISPVLAKSKPKN